MCVGDFQGPGRRKNSFETIFEHVICVASSIVFSSELKLTYQECLVAFNEGPQSVISLLRETIKVHHHCRLKLQGSNFFVLAPALKVGQK